MIVSIIAALAESNRGIGLRGGLPWRLPADMAHFKELTMGHAVIMGRRTWESISTRGLPGRRVIVLSRDPSWKGGKADTAHSLEAALQMAKRDVDETEAFIAGGAEVYQLALDRTIVERMYLTVVHAEIEADAYFPAYDNREWTTVKKDFRAADSENPYPLTYTQLERTPFL